MIGRLSSRHSCSYNNNSIGISRKCDCPYIGATRKRDCSCPTIDDPSKRYISPLLQVHWKRLIVGKRDRPPKVICAHASV